MEFCISYSIYGDYNRVYQFRRPFIGNPCHSIYNDRLGAHLVGCKKSQEKTCLEDSVGDPCLMGSCLIVGQGPFQS